jgi:hypothetical protein
LTLKKYPPCQSEQEGRGQFQRKKKPFILEETRKMKIRMPMLRRKPRWRDIGSDFEIRDAADEIAWFSRSRMLFSLKTIAQ